jgi:rhamnose utilization protein RhaD (predicted bifunctional aldolase and dehydrogenase)/NAD(P)-dependent dehydrogenase (short-subunit alcohol dehydrogenase family)
MQSLWSDLEAQAAVSHYAARGEDEDIALRTYTARLLGGEPALVMHGGGNTSVKTTVRDLFGDPVEVLRVKGSGWDLAAIEPAGHPAVRIAPLLQLRRLQALSDEEMVNAQRQNLLDSTAPNPSVETLLHAFLPHRFVDHTHSVAVCALVDQPSAEAVVREVWGDRVACVPYIMPGFALAKAAIEAWEANPQVEGLILLKHGVFSFGETARESYERMISLVDASERFIAARAPALGQVTLPASRVPVAAKAAEILPTFRGGLARAAAAANAHERWILDLRGGVEVRAVVDRSDLPELARRGVSTPDHVIRTKAGPVVLPPLDAADWRAGMSAALVRFADDYRAYFARHAQRAGGDKRILDALPRLATIPGLGLIGIGRSAKEAAVAADVGEAWAATVLRAEAVGRYEPVGEADLFDMEYWSLEQAKLGKTTEKPLARHVAVVTGTAGAIGAATARAFAAEGAEIALLDINAEAVARTAATLGVDALPVACDVTDPASVAAALDAVATRFGGIDIVVFNAGVAISGAMADIPEGELRRSLELNFFGNQHVAKASSAILRRQGRGGAFLFNVSKQAVNPGPDFGAYGTAKAALLALMRQYALELGAEGVRVNAVNADRIRSGLLDDRMITARAAARGGSEAEYMAGNLLRREVKASDVAQAFVGLALAQATTGCVFTVDGGNVAAMMR